MTQVTKTGYVEPTVKVDTSQRKQESSKTNIPKTIGKTALNIATNMGEGALKTLENVADTASDVVFNPIERKANYVYDFITKGKKVADENIKDLAQMQQRDIKRNLVNELNQATGWNQMKNQWEKDSLVKSGNFGGQVAQGIGGMVPSLVVGGAFGAEPALTNTSNLAGKEKLIASLGNVGKTYASQLPANVILGASSYGSGMEKALNQGATIDQARKYGLANAAIEQATEMMTGGVPGLQGKGGIDNYVEPLINKNTNSYLNALLKAGYGALGEGLEESTGTYLESLAKKGILGQNIDWNEVNKEALQSGLTGSTIGAILNAPSNIQNIKDVRTENQIRNAIGDAEYAEGNQQYNPEYKGWEEQRYANELKERKKQKEIQNRERIAREAQIKAQESQNQQESTNILEQPKTLAETQKKAQEKLIRDEEYNKYYKKADLDKFDDNYVSKAKEVISANKQGKRTKQEWLDVADNIGMQLRGQDPETIKKYAYESFKSERPNVKENLNRQGQRYVGFKVDEWVDAVEKSANVGVNQKEVNITPTENVAEKVEQPMIKSNEYQDAIKKVREGTATEKDRSYIKTATESQNTEEYLKEMNETAQKYEPISNETSIKNAENQLSSFKTLEQRVNYIESTLQSGKRVTSSDIAAAEIVLKEAAASKNVELYNKVLADTALLGTEYGQAIQALSMIRKMSPTAQLDVLEKIINREKAKGNKSYENVKVTNEMRNKILDCYDENGKVNQEKFDATMEEIKVDLAKDIKASIGDKIRAWRYLSMLGNPKTHVRNMVANAAMTIVKKTKDLGSGLTQDIFIHDKNKQTATLKLASKEVKNLANEKIKELYTKDAQTSKYNEKSDLENRKQVFKLKAFEGARKINESALSAEDTISKRINFKSAFTNYLTAHGISTTEDIKNNSQIIREATAFAEQEANVATFNQRNQLAEYINKLDNLGEFGKIARGAIIPFTRTPLNIAKTGIEYTPGTGMITTIADMKKAPNDMKGAVLIDGLSKQMTGASLALLGYILAKAGKVTAKTDDDKEDEFLKDKGAKADYSIKLGDTSYDLSWLSPSSMPFFVGARMFEVLDKQEGFNPNVIMEGLASTLDPLSEMSVIKSFTDVLSSYQKDPNKMIQKMGESTVENYISQFIPTLSGQFARFFDDKKRSTYADADSKFAFGEKVAKTVAYNIPGLRNKLPEQTDYTGQTKKEEVNIAIRAFDSFLNPANKKKDTMTKEDKELIKIYNKTGNDEIIPYDLSSSLKFNDNDYKMSQKEYNKYKRDFGNTYEKNLKELMDTDDYKNATNDEKAEIISGIMGYSKDKAKDNFLTKKGEDYTKTTKKGEKSLYESDKVDSLTNDNFSVSDYYIYKTNTPNIVNGNVANVKNKINLINTFGIDNEIYSKYMEDIQNIKGKDRKQQIFNYINGLNLTAEQKQLLMKKVYKTYNKYDRNLFNTINNSDLTLQEKESLKNFLKIGE